MIFEAKCGSNVASQISTVQKRVVGTCTHIISCRQTVDTPVFTENYLWMFGVYLTLSKRKRYERIT